MRTKLDIITNIQLVLWVMILGLCGGIEFLHGWNILLNVLLMILTGAIIFLLSTLKGVMKYEYKRKRAYEVNELREKIKNLTYNRQHQLLNFTILGNGRVIFLNQKQDGWNIRITGNGPIREGHLATMESVRRYIWSELHE